MRRIAFLLAALLLPLVAIACGGDDTKPASSPQAQSTPGAAATSAVPATGTAGPATSSVYSSATTWDVGKASDDVWKQACGGLPYTVRETDPCVVTVMQRANASQQAIDFFKANGYFLRTFTEQGLVDHGRGSAPWINMGRDTFQLFLNGTPGLQELSKMTPENSAATDYKKDPRYADVLKKEPEAFPWPEYGELMSSKMQPDGTQRMQLSIPMMKCRACENVAQFILDLDFDKAGAFKTASLEAPSPPKQR